MRFSVLMVVVVFALFGGTTGCPSQTALESCLSDCQRVGDACNPGDAMLGTFSASACQDICREDNSRLILFPDCVPCLADEVSCDVNAFLSECVPEHCWDPEVWNETGEAVPYRR